MMVVLGWRFCGVRDLTSKTRALEVTNELMEQPKKGSWG